MATVNTINNLPALGRTPTSGDKLALQPQGDNTKSIDYDALATAIINKLGGDPVTIEHGGFGGTTAAQARTNLSVYSKAETDNAIAQSTAFHVGDTFVFHGAQVPFRTLNDKSGIYFRYRLPKNVGSDVTGFTVNISGNSGTWFSGGSIGAVPSGATLSNVLLANGAIAFSVVPSGTIQSTGFGICELSATVTFT